jgi:hypothetical protein
MSLNFNQDPWYDDFDPTKNFHRILFKPGYAVQARELTQSQTILQDQISKFGKGIYEDGSKVTGGNIFIDTKVVTVKLTSASQTQISSYVGLFVVGATSKFIAEVISIDANNYYINTKPVNIANNKQFSSGETLNFFETKILALASLNSTVTASFTDVVSTTNIITRLGNGTYLNKILNVSTAGLSVGDTVKIASIKYNGKVVSLIDGNNLQLDKSLPTNVVNLTVTITNEVSVRCMEVGIDEGVWFTNGYFVRNKLDTIIPDQLSSNPSVVVGFEVEEFIIDAVTDSSLLDPAIGASNYQAPGADRYNITLALTAKPYVSDQTVANLTTNKFIELVRINAGIVEDINNVPAFTSISKAIAQAVSDQSGDFVVNPYSLLIADSYTASNTFTSSISAGKVYLNGEPVEHISQTPFLLNKSRDTESLTNQDIVTYYGNYTLVKNLKGSIINFQTGSSVELHNVVASSATSSTKIGTAHVRNFDYDSGTGTNIHYKLFLFDIQTTDVFANVVSIVTPNGSDYVNRLFSANTIAPVTTVDSGYDFLLFPFPQNNIANVSSSNYVTHRHFPVPNFINGVTTIFSSGLNELFVGGSGAISSPERLFNYSVVTTSSSGDYAAGQFIPMDQANVSITINNSGTPQATVNIGGSFDGSGTIYATISVTNDNIKGKNLNLNEDVLTSANTLLTQIDLGKSDIYNFKGVFELGNTTSYLGTWSSSTIYATDEAVLYDDANVYISIAGSNSNQQPNTSISYWSQVENNLVNYSTDNGQTDIYYDHGTITNISGQPKGNVVVVFDYFTHSGGTGFFDVNSYTINYGSIPSYTSKQHGKTYQLRDVLDFRPRRTDGVGVTTFDKFQLPAPFQNVFSNYGYYLSRTDKIVLYPNGQFKTLRGVSSYINPTPPANEPGALTLFTVNFPAYTFRREDILVTPNNTRRYTMKDIGVLDKRIFNLEYYTSLTALENQVTGSDVTDATGLNLLFKNGFLTDNFKGQGVADVLNPDYNMSVDFTKQLARPTFTSNVASYTVDTNQGTFVTSGKVNNQLRLNNNIVTFSYDESTMIYQNVATQIINVNPFNVVNFIGNIKLSPSSDVWYDTNSQPNVNIVNEDQSAWTAAVNGTGHGTQWNDWQINWTGENPVVTSDQTTVARDTQAITTAITSQGLSGVVNGGNIQVSATTQILSTSVIPYARAIPVQFEVFGMVPYTYLHTFANGVCIDSYVTPNKGSSDGLYFVDITSAGSGYTDGNNQSIITVTGNSKLPVIATANVSGGQIVSVDILKTGSGYTEPPTLTVTGANTGQAILTANTSGYPGARLITNENGYASGSITIPNDGLVRLPTGTITVEFADNFLTPLIGSAYAKTTFYSKGTLQTSQTTVVSTRPPKVTPKPQVVNRSSAPSTYQSVYYPQDTGGGYTPITPTTTPPPPGVIIPWVSDPLNPNINSIYHRDSNGDPNAASYAYVQAYVTTSYTQNAGYTNWTPTDQDLIDIHDGFNTVVDTISATVGQGGVTATEALAGSLYVANEVAAGSSIEEAQASLAAIVESYAGNSAGLDALASSYISDNSAQNAAGQAAGDIAGSAACTDGVDPLSQNFFINANLYPNGAFVSSVKLFFASKDPTVPVNVRIRPTVNGYPDAVNDVPGSLVYKNPVDVNIPVGVLDSSIGPSTTFTFDYPIFLKPGQYTLMVATDSNKYTVYASKLGGVEFGTQNVLTQLNYLGSLFKSQNASTWAPAGGETLAFIMNICDFAGGTVTFDTKSKSSTEIDYDLAQLITQDLTFNSLDSINYKILTHDLTTNIQSNPTSLLANENYNFTARQKQTSASDIIIRPTLTNTDRWTSPVIDLERLNTILIKNIITPYYSANTVSESLGGYYNGGASARYITRRVTLNNNFDSTGLTVFVDVNRQPGTKIEVYYKVISILDLNSFDSQPYVLMDPILLPGNGLPYTGRTDWVSDTYQALDITYNDITTNALYTSYNIFAVKIVMYSSNPAIVPQIKNFRAIATA